MDLRQIRYFAAVQEGKSVLAASRQLNVSQPALSKSLRNLEASLGRPLFRRHARGVVLTDAGEKFAVHAAEILAAVDRASTAFSQVAQPTQTISIGSTPMSDRTLLPDLLKRVGRKHPELRLTIQQGSNQELFDLLSRGVLDAILCYAVPNLEGITIKELYDEELYLVGKPDRMNFREKEARFVDVAALPLVLDPRTHVSRRQIDRGARSKNLRLNILAEIEPLAAKKSILIERESYAILPYASVVEDVADGKLTATRIVDPVLTLTLNLILPQAALPEIGPLLSELIEPVVRDEIARNILRWQSPLSP
jgi:DNA-binding transcriptional LysR family regulator